MIVELDKQRHRMSLQKLFENYPCLHGCVESILEGKSGEVFTDSEHNPNVALAISDFQFLAGNPFNENTQTLLHLLNKHTLIIAPTVEWQKVLLSYSPGKIESSEREAFLADTFDIKKLNGFISKLPSNFELRRIDIENVKLFSELSPDLTICYETDDDFVEHGIGFGIFHKNKVISGASSSPLTEKKLEIEVQTHHDFRRQGFARIVVSALILHCLENSIEPCWDAANEPSSRLAKQLGFSSTGKYSVYWLT